MRTRFLRGNTTENNGLTLEPGEFSMDLEAKALRLHDGATPGGFELLGTRAYEPQVGPGSEVLLAGDDQLGWYGEVSGSDLLTYSTLATDIGLSAGTLQHDAESLWLKFAYQGKILFVAKKPARHTVSWDDIDAVGAVFGTTQVTIGSNTYNVRLMTGGDADPATATGGEWNDLLYRVHVDDPTGSGWASYTDTDIVVGTGYGRASWAQEANASNSGSRVNRGNSSLTYFTVYTSSNANSAYGWRPVLELVV